MGKPVIIDFETDEEWRRDMGRRGIYEINAILEVLNANEDRGQIDQDLWRGSYLRLDTLVSVVMAGLGSDERREAQDIANAFYGEEGWKFAEPAEAT